MGSKFSIPALLNLCSKSVGHKNLRSYLRTPTLVVLVQLPLERNTLLFNSDIMNFFWKTNEGETESIALLMFVLWRCFHRRWARGCGVGVEAII